MKKHLLFLFAAFATLAASAQTKVEIDGIWYNLNSSTKQAEVTMSSSEKYAGSINIPSCVNYKDIEYNVTSIKENAFNRCSNLTSISISENIASIGIYAFYFCSSLTSVIIPDDSNLERIEECAFRGCSSLSSITIPNNVTYIGLSAFYDCCSLTSIILPKNKTVIYNYAFKNCTNLSSITFPNGIEKIYSYAFQNCCSLTSIVIPESVDWIEDGAFGYCSSLTSIVVDENNTTYDSRKNCNAIIKTNDNALLTGCSTTIIPKNIASIKSEAFMGCNNLMSITIPGSVTNIGSSAFKDCNSLTSITIPESVTSIDTHTFYGCSNLTTIIMNSSLMNGVGYEAFANCPKLLDVYCYAERIPESYSNAFVGSNVENAILHVPEGSIEAYENAEPWKNFKEIKAITETEPLKKCASPTISYRGGKVVLACDTEEVEFVTEAVVGESEIHLTEATFDLIPTYTITAYATKENYEDSDEVTLTLCWIPCDGNHATTDATSIPSKPVLISTQGGTITVSGLAAGTAVEAYSTAGTLLATATATDGSATLATDLEAGNIAIVKKGDYSVKIAIK